MNFVEKTQGFNLKYQLFILFYLLSCICNVLDWRLRKIKSLFVSPLSLFPFTNFNENIKNNYLKVRYEVWENSTSSNSIQTSPKLKWINIETASNEQLTQSTWPFREHLAKNVAK